MKNFIRYLIIFGVVCFGIIGTQSQASQDILRRAFECQYNLIEYSSETGSATIELIVEQFHEIKNLTECDRLQITIIPIDGLEYFGIETWEVEISINNPYKTQIDVKVPVNDTSGFLVHLKCDKIDRKASNYIMAVNDTVLFTKSNPLYQHHLPRYGTPEEEAERRRKIGEEADRRYAEQQKKLLAHKPKVTTQPIAPLTSEDSLIYNTLTDAGKKTYAKMKYIELQGPSTEPQGESALIDNYGFARDSGQTYFYRVKSVPTEELRAESHRIRDSILANSPPKVYDIIVDLSKIEDYTYFKDKVDFIEKTDSEGFYRIKCSKEVISEIEQKKINYRRTNRPSWIMSDSVKAERKKQKEFPKKIGSIEESFDNKSSLFFEGFELVWPGNWNAGDGNSNNGYDYWGDLLDWYVYSGYWSAWCADEGDMPEGEYYDNYMYAYMEYTIPVDLTEYENRRLIYQVLYDTESGYDYMDRYASSDGFIWTFQERVTGNSGGWEEINKPILTTGNYYMRFVFESDYTINTDYVGVYIDDIEVTGNLITYPNLTYDWPISWSNPIVASSVTGTNFSSTLYGDDPTYIDWAIENNGDIDASPFHVGLYLDNVLIGEWSYTTLWYYSSTFIEDYSHTISPGYHTLKLWVDNRYEVAEFNELDNIYETGFYWESPEIHYTGTVEFWDLNINTIQKPAKGILIQLLDRDGMTWDTLASDVTDNFGRFDFGTVFNNTDTDDGNGNKHDILFAMYADNDACYVIGNSTLINKNTTPPQNNHPSGVFDTFPLCQYK